MDRAASSSNAMILCCSARRRTEPTSARRSSRGCLMSDPPRPDSGSARTEDERLVHALISRGLIPREEAQPCRAGETLGARKLLARLVECGSLTASQAARAEQE